VSAGRHSSTAIVGVLLATVGFGVGAGGSAWQTREQRADPWRKLHVEHQGVEGLATRTRVVFENPKLALQAVEVIRNPEGEPELARIALRGGAELTARYEDGERPTSLEGPDGSRAVLTYKGTKAKVAFFAADGRQVGSKSVRVPVELRSALRLARDARPNASTLDLREALGALAIGEAWAQDEGGGAEAEDLPVTVQRDVTLLLDVGMPGAKSPDPGKAQIAATCAPFTCLPAAPDVQVPGQSSVRITVSATKLRSELDAPGGKSALTAFQKDAKKERSTATKVMPDVAAVVAVVGVTAQACKSKKLSWPICVKALRKGPAAGAAIQGVSSHQIKTAGPLVDGRARALYYEDQARSALDGETTIEVCLSREGYARVCTKVEARPFAEEPMDDVERGVELRRGIGGTLVGSFAVTQSDGADCKFSPSPKTGGTLRLSFDNVRHTVTGLMKTEQRGTRPNLGCSVGTANMSWSQNYTISLTQTFTEEQLASGGKLPLRLTGTMSGAGSYSFSGCRSRGGASANCPAGKRDSYSYPTELIGEIDLTTQTGTGNIVVRNAPLSTNGTWSVPAVKAP